MKMVGLLILKLQEKNIPDIILIVLFDFYRYTNVY